MNPVSPGKPELLAATDGRWQEALERVPHDVYHTAAYHRAPALDTSGEPRAFLYREGEQVFLWPYVLMPIAEAPGCHDVSSVYGYPGPVSSPGRKFIERAWRLLLDHWREQQVVSVFTRFNPLLGNAGLLDGITDSDGVPASQGLRDAGPTVCINLAQPLDQQVHGYNKQLRQNIRKLHEAGFVCSEDAEFAHIGDFLHVYRETMLRRGSRPELLVDAAWVDEFRRAMGPSLRHFVTKFEGSVVAAMLVLEHKLFVHCHLTGTAVEFAQQSPAKALLDYVRVWGTQRGLCAMHLGGGLGGRQDSLFDYKRKFSPVTYPFQIGCWILDPMRYAALAAEHHSKLAGEGRPPGESAYFPAYRAPAPA